MFLLCILLYICLDIANGHYIDSDDLSLSATIMQTQMATVLGVCISSKNTPRERSSVDVLFIWAAWIVFSDWVEFDIPPVASLIETALFTVSVMYVYRREYQHISMPINTENVCIAFYGGPNAPFLSRIASHFGYAFSSVAIVVNGIGARPSKSSGRMVETTPGALSTRGYVFIDTGVKSTPEMMGKLKGLLSTPTGHGLLRYKCLSNLLPVLELLGPEWVPKGKLNLPSTYYKDCVGNVA